MSAGTDCAECLRRHTALRRPGVCRCSCGFDAKYKHRHATDAHGQPWCGRHIRDVMHTTQFHGAVTCPGCAEALERAKSAPAAR